MMTTDLVGKKELEKCITDFVAPFGLTAVLDTDFAYYYANDTVTFSIFYFGAYEDFLLDAESRFPQVNGVSPFIWSLLHEIGHHETWDELTEEEIDESMQIKESIDVDDHASRMTYYTCPDEYAATDWAGHYIETHREKVEEFWYKVLLALKKFYASNNIAE
jgi:hypothetical protein